MDFFRMSYQNFILRIICATLGLFSAGVIAEESKRPGYSYLGVGVTQLSYQESTDSNGLSIRSEVSGAKFTQRSGAYVSINSQWGFYLTSSSYFGSDSLDEDWKINGTKVQENQFTSKRNEVQLLVTRELSAGRHYLLFGGSNIETSFTRFDFSYPGQDLYEVTEEDRNITEDVSQFVGFIGYEYNEFYSVEQPGIRYQLQALFGIPVYSEILNNAAGDNTFDTSFDGYSLSLNPSVGWQFDQHFLVSLGVGIHYSYRSEEKKNAEGGVLVLPERDIFRVYPAVSMYWSF